MKHFLAVLTIFGWFFTLEFPYSDVEGARITSLFGPFSTEMVCRQQYTTIVEYLDAVGLSAARVGCTYIQEM